MLRTGGLKFAVCMFIQFLSGFVLMSYEMLVPRILAPRFGMGYETWACVVIAVFLAMSLGNRAAGLYSERFGPLSSLRLALSGAFVSLSMSAIFFGAFIEVPFSLGMSGDVLSLAIPVAALVFPQSFFFGMVSPSVVSIVGDESGDVGAAMSLETVGGLFGAMTGSFLLPRLLGATASMSAFPLVILPAVLLVPLSRGRRAAVLLVAAGVVASGFAAAEYRTSRGNTRIFEEGTVQKIFEVDTMYSVVSVVEKTSKEDGKKTRFFLQNGASLSKGREDDPSFTYAYFDIFNIPLSEALRKNGSANILMIGGGGYSWPRRIFHEHPDARVNFTVVEIDPAVPEIAKDFFWKPDGVDTVVGDGRKELSRMDDDSFDIVAVDVYSGKDIPYHLVTKEFFEMVRRKLKPDGTLASNVVTDSGSDFARLFTSTKKSVFPFVGNYFTEGCMVVLGSASGLPDSGFDRLKKAVGSGDGKIFTDDWNPVELTF